MLSDPALSTYQTGATDVESHSNTKSKGFSKKVIGVVVASILFGCGIASVATRNNQTSHLANLKASKIKVAKVLSPEEVALREQELREKEAAAAERAEEARIKKLPWSYVPARDYKDPCDVGRGTCCTDESYPVLGGMDVVQYKLNGEIAFGDSRYSATLKGTSRSYTFWFGDKAYASLFNLNPESYIPKFGGFEATKFCSSGGGLETLVSETLDISRPQGDFRNLFYAEPSVDVSSCENIWNTYFGSATNGIFNTRCVDFSHIMSAPGMVDFLPAEATPVKQSTLLGVPSPGPSKSKPVSSIPAANAPIYGSPNIPAANAPVYGSQSAPEAPTISTQFQGKYTAPVPPSTSMANGPPASLTHGNVNSPSVQDALKHASQGSGPASFAPAVPAAPGSASASQKYASLSEKYAAGKPVASAKPAAEIVPAQPAAAETYMNPSVAAVAAVPAVPAYAVPQASGYAGYPAVAPAVPQASGSAGYPAAEVPHITPEEKAANAALRDSRRAAKAAAEEEKAVAAADKAAAQAAAEEEKAVAAADKAAAQAEREAREAREYQSASAAGAGNYAPAQPAGNYAPAQPVGNYAPAPPVGNYAPAPPVGNYAPAPPVGNYAPAPPVGNYAPAPAVGNYDTLMTKFGFK